MSLSFSSPQAGARFRRMNRYFVLRSVACEYHEGVLILRGRAPSFYLKQVAQTLAGKVDGVEIVVNRLVVDY